MYIVEYIAIFQGGFDAGYLYECEFLDEKQRDKLSDEERDQPTRTISVHDSSDHPVNAVTFRYHVQIQIKSCLFFINIFFSV